jgi:hypothetical protein
MDWFFNRAIGNNQSSNRTNSRDSLPENDEFTDRVLDILNNHRSPVRDFIRDLEQNPELIGEFEQVLVDAKKRIFGRQISQISQSISRTGLDAQTTFINLMNQILEVDTELKSVMKEIRNSCAQSIDMIDASGKSQYMGVVFRMNLKTFKIDICLLPAGAKPNDRGQFDCLLVKYPDQRINPMMFLYQNGFIWLESVHIDQPTAVSIYTTNQYASNEYFYMLLNSSLFTKLNTRLGLGF